VEPCSLVSCLNSGGGSKVLIPTPRLVKGNHSRSGLVQKILEH